MAKHIITGTAAPVDAPTELGQHFVDTVTPAIYFSIGTATVADWVLVQDADALGTISTQDANNVSISGGSITNLTTLEVPVSATPTVANDGEIALDTTVADFSHGVIKFFGTEEQGVVSMPIAEFTTPSDGHVVAYNATNDEFELVAQTSGVTDAADLTYTPTTLADWDGAADPGDAQEAFDQLAERVTDLEAAAYVAPVITEAGTTYDIDAADNGSYIRFTSTSAKTVTVRDEADHALPANGEWHLRNVGTNDLTLVEDTAVTINVPNGGTLVLEPGMTVTLKRVAADEFDLFGQTVPA